MRHVYDFSADPSEKLHQRAGCRLRAIPVARAAFFGQGFGKFSERAFGDGCAGEEPVDFREFLRVFVVAEMVFAEVLRERGVNVRTIAAVHDLELFKIVQDGDGCRTAPAVTGGLEIIARLVEDAPGQIQRAISLLSLASLGEGKQKARTVAHSRWN